MERDVYLRLLEACDVAGVQEEDEISFRAAKLDVHMKSVQLRFSFSERHEISTLSSEDSQDILRTVFRYMEMEGWISSVPNLGPSESKLLCEKIAFREAYVYRDWQDGIGSWMIASGQTNQRGRKILMSYDEFERRIGTPEDSLWFDRVAGLFDDLQIAQNGLDTRYQQIKNILFSLSDLIEAITSANNDNFKIPEKMGKVVESLRKGA